ncbi:MAG TPA: hypothetical protein VFO66_09075, partial [Gemmatimonadaceae bacterium]|nr:hypothetical protein [Gemmatimonadaceae bacterium]
HFEKMLYDNALLLRVGTHLLQADDAHPSTPDIRAACDGIVRWLATEMTAPEGGFYSALDADSEGHEGRFYVWSETELRELLGNEAQQLIEYWGVTAGGNFEGQNILHVREGARRPANLLLWSARETLLAARAKRVRPGRDDKVLASWNGLMLRALAEFDLLMRRATGLGAKGAKLTLPNAEFLYGRMVRNGRVLRSFKDGEARIPGFLEDHAALGLGFLAVYELTFDRVWLDRAREMASAVLEWFWDDETNALYDTARDAEELVTRPRDTTDNATPSGTSLAVELMLRIADLCGEPEMARRANFTLETLAAPMAQHPLAFGHALTAADMAVHGAVEIALVGDPAQYEFQQLLVTVGERYIPSRVLAGGPPGSATGVPLMENREAIDGKPTAYVCRGYVCERPVTTPADLWEQLGSAARA